MTGRKRKLVKFIALFLLGTVLIAITVPIWIGPLLPLVLRPLHVQYRSDERVGWNRLVLHDVQYRHATVSVLAKKVELWAPFLWASPLRRSQSVKVEEWKISIISIAEPPAQSKKIRSTWDLLNEVSRVEIQLWRWLPKAEFFGGELELRNQRVVIPEAIWDERLLQATVHIPQVAEPIRVKIAQSSPRHWKIGATALNADVQVSLRLRNSDLQGEGELAWQKNKIRVRSSFGREGWWPLAGRIESEELEYPVTWLKQQGFDPVQGKIVGIWNGKQLDTTIEAQLSPSGDDREVKPIAMKIEGVADLKGLQLNHLTLRTQGLDLRMIDPMRLEYKPPFLMNPATLIFKADISQLPWKKVTGQVGGYVELRPGGASYPQINLSLEGRTGYQDIIELDEVGIRARLNWPWIELHQAVAVTTNQARGDFTGRYHLVEKILESGRFNWKGIPNAEWFEEDFSLDDFEIEAEVVGPLKNLSHQGTFAMTQMRYGNYAPINIQTKWKGMNGSLSQLRTLLAWDSTRVQWEGQGEWEPGRVIWTNSIMTVEQEGRSVLQLEKPSVLEWIGATNGPSWRLHLNPMEWGGRAGEVRLAGNIEWPEKGEVDLSVLNFLPQELHPNLPSVTLKLLRIQGDWNRSPMSYEVAFDGAYQPYANEAPVRLLVDAVGDESGMYFKQIEVLEGLEKAFSGQAVLPVRLGPGLEKWFEWSETDTMNVQVQSYPQAGLWKRLESLSGMVIRNPDVKLAVTGSKHQPKALLEARIQAVQLNHPNRQFPRVEGIETEIQYDGHDLELARLQARVAGQPIEAYGKVPFEIGDFWQNQLDRAQGRLQFTAADMTPVLQSWTNLFIPQGKLDLDVELKPGMKLEGKVEARGLESRPLANMGPLQDIHLAGTIQDREIRILQGGASIGGDLVNLSGKVDWSRIEAGLPEFLVRIQAAEVPLARRPDLILRSGFDLSIRHETNQPVMISGQVLLTNSVYLSDLELLIPGKVATPDRRPPYFSITNQPIADWKLAIEIQGNRFIRIRSPIFRGEVGLQARLQGTLREPVLLGQATIPSGYVQFPFGNLEIRQGTVSLTSDNPYQPQIDLRAGSRVFGYEVQMTLRGSIQEPILEFNSIPGLTSEQVVLMLTAGELPQQEIRFSNRQKATSLGLFLGKNLLAQFSEDASLADRLTVSSGQDVSSEGRQTYLVEYRLSENWSLIAEYDRFGAYNGEVKWRFFSR